MKSRRARVALVGAQLSAHPSLALGCLKAAADADPILQGKVDVELLDLVGPTVDDILDGLGRGEPRVIGFSCYVWNSSVFFESLPRVRAAHPDALLVLGGPDVYPQASRVLAEHPEVDVVVVGEGELTFPRLVAAWLEGGDWRGLAGLAYRREGACVLTPAAPLIADLDGLPSPYLSGALGLGPEVRRVTLETSRGCPFDCKFCDWPGRKQRPRTFSVDRVIAELEHVLARASGLWIVNLADADIFVDKARAAELVRRARALLEGTNVLMSFEVYLGRLDQDLIALLDYPNFALEGGVQTATPEALAAVKRFFHRGRIERAVGWIQTLACPPYLGLQLIFGLPGDTLEGFRATLDWALSLKTAGVAAYRALVLPGSDMGQHPERYELSYDSKPPRRVLATPSFPARDIASASVTVAALTALQRVPSAGLTLSHLAGLPGGGSKPFLSVHEEFARLLVADGVLPPDEETEATHDAFAFGAHAADRILSDPEALRRVRERLKGFAAGALAARGRSDLLAVFEHFWLVAETFDLWVASARAGEPELTRRVDEDLAGARSAAWLGLEALNPETALSGRGPSSSEVFHFFSAAPRSYRCLQKVRHFGGVDGLRRRAARAAPVDVFVLSHLFGRLAPRERDGLLAYAESSTARASRLVVWDGLLGASPLESLASQPDRWRPSVPEMSSADVVAEISARGWSLELPPERAAAAWHFRFVRN